MFVGPRCPAELEGLGPFERPAPWIDPGAQPRGSCPYSFAVRGDCLRHRNERALEAALLQPAQATRVSRLLEALGYVVEAEPVDPGRRRPRILKAHSAGPSGRRDVRVVSAPGVGALVLVRDRAGDAGHPVGSERRLRVLPLGSNG